MPAPLLPGHPVPPGGRARARRRIRARWPMLPGLRRTGSRAGGSSADGETNMAPLPGSPAPHGHHITDLTLIRIRLAHTYYYIEDKSVLITLSAVTLQPVNFWPIN